MYRQPAAPPRTRLPLLDRVAIKTPCTASWGEMEGDDRVRFCCTCRKNVYDLSAMTEDEAEAFLAFHLDDQDACVKLYRRPDGRILTTDCPRGASTRHARRAALAGAAAVCAVAAMAAVVGDARVPRAHGLPRSTSRFEVPRAAPVAPRPSLEGIETAETAPESGEPWGVDDPRADEVYPPGLQGMGGIAFVDRTPVPYGKDPRWPPGGVTNGPRIRLGTTTVSAGLPPEVVMRITRQNVGRFRVAYERGLKRNKSLAGRIVVQFTIAPDGSVARASDQGSSLTDSDVIRDVVRSFVSLAFPTPAGGGPVLVTLPLDFSPAA
jgi:hypothetical protein